MRILFSSMSLPGHLNPVLPYAQALRDQGHEVRYCTPKAVADKIEKAGLIHVPSRDTSLDEIIEAFAGTEDLPQNEKDKIIIPRCFVELAAGRALPTVRETIASWKPDLIIRESCEFAALIAAREANVPHVRIAVVHSEMERKFAQFSVEAVDALSASIGLAADAGASLISEPAYTAFPASLGKTRVAEDAPDLHRVQLPQEEVNDTPQTWTPETDAPLIYVTFGTQSGTNERERAIYRTALDAVADLPVRVLLTTGPNMAEHPLGKIPANVTVETFVPQNEVFKHAKLVVTHGGSGTVLGALSAGLPLVVAPMFADQPDNARAVDAAGCGTAVFDASPESLRMAIEHVLEDRTFGDAAQAVADEMRSFDSIDQAAQRMLEHVSHPAQAR